MEMESSRRLVDKTRVLGLKRTRLADEAERNRAGSGDGAFIPRFRVSDGERGGGKGRVIVDDEKERDDSGRGAHHQQQGLLSQYKTAIGELTFNSKPIITNLTIIAGENTHAAKGIASTICGNILEVPSDQKLPSLYLLDSIVKNIGGEYVKYFTVRLPEVFCKAYRQVNTTIHSSMQHLFRTWKGVFPLQTLRAIEQELSFPPVNGSPSGVPASRSDSQSQRPGHSIHVNPKYLEARQRLQSGRSRGIGTENCGNLLLEEAGRSERASLSESPKPWVEAPVKVANVQRPQRGECVVESLYGKKPGSGYGNYEFGSDSASHQGIGVTRLSERDMEGDGGEQAWCGGMGNSEANTTFGKRSGYDIANLPRGGVDSYKNHGASRSAQTLPQLNSASNVPSFRATGISRNWKNSEEEEFMWNDMNSRTRDLVGSDGLQKGGWNSNPSEKVSRVQMRRWIQTGSEDLDSNWSQDCNLSRSSRPVEADDDEFPSHRDLDEQVQRSYSQNDGGSRDNREASVDSSSVGQGEAVFVHQAGRIPQEKRNQVHTASRLLDIDTLNSSSRASSSDVGQLEGRTVAVGGNIHSTVALRSIGRAGIGGQAGSVGPSSFLGPFDGIPGHQQQQPRRPAPPSMLTSLQQCPHSPSSISHQVHVELQQPYGLSEHAPPQAISFLPAKKSSNVVSLSTTPPPVHGDKELWHMSRRHTEADTSGVSQLQQQLRPPPPHFHGALSSPVQEGMHLPLVQSEPSQTLGQSWQPQAQPQAFGLQTAGYSSSGLLKKPSLQAESSTDSLLAAILKTGLLTAQTAASTDAPKSNTGFSSANYPDAGQSRLHLNVHPPPPLPSGPPPVQLSASSHSESLSTSTVGSGLQGALSAVSLPISGTSQPPWPPGPAAVSLIPGTPSQSLSSSKVAKNLLSSLLSSLVAKGLISTSATELSKPTPVQVPNQIQDQSDDDADTSNLVSTVSPLTPADGELSVSESSSMPSGRSNTSTEIRDGLGIEFKPAIFRKFHLSVINGLFDDLPHQCSMCGRRFKYEHDLCGHLNWHASSMLELEKDKLISRKWYLSWRDWVEGAPDPSSAPIHIPGKEMVLPDDKSEPLVPADESQSICISCGEPFEDFYCHTRDEWMFNGATYMTVPTGGSASKKLQKLIVHANCITESTIDNLKGPQSSDMDQTSG